VKQMEVTIMGQSYLLGCPEGGEDALRAAVAQVDREMSAIRDTGKVKARERIAVLAALNLAYQLSDAPASAHQEASLVSPDVDALIKRLDDALDHDGQLI
jgi:cell division protein ZapA